MAYSVLPTVSAGETISSTDWGNVVKANIEALKDPPSHEIERDNTALYSTNSTSFVAIDSTNFKATITTTGGDVWVHMTITIHADSATARRVFFDLSVDGGAALYEGQGYASGYAGAAVQTTVAQIVNLDWLISGLAAGAHTFAPMYKVDAGTCYVHSDTSDATATNENPAILWAREVS